LKKTEKRLSVLHFELEQIQAGQVETFDESYLENDEEDTAEEDAGTSTSKEAVSGISKRASVITQQILSMLPAASSSKCDAMESQVLSAQGAAIEKQIARRSSSILGRIGLQRPPTVSSSTQKTPVGPEVSSMSSASSKMLASAPERKSSVSFAAPAAVVEPAEEVVALSSSLEKVLLEASTNDGDEEGKSTAEPTHKRVFDPQHDRHYYVDLISGHSSWTLPSEGIISCM